MAKIQKLEIFFRMPYDKGFVRGNVWWSIEFTWKLERDVCIANMKYGSIFKNGICKSQVETTVRLRWQRCIIRVFLFKFQYPEYNIYRSIIDIVRKSRDSPNKGFYYVYLFYLLFICNILSQRSFLFPPKLDVSPSKKI